MTTTKTPRPNSARQGTPYAQPRSPKLPVLLLELVIDEYERDLRRSRLSERTVHNYAQILRLAVRFWTEQLGRPSTLDDFTLRHAEAFQDHLVARGKLPTCHRYDTGPDLSTETVRTYLRALKVFASWLAAPKQRYTTENRLALLPQ